jgi:hypothetical protein
MISTGRRKEKLDLNLRDLDLLLIDIIDLEWY